MYAGLILQLSDQQTVDLVQTILLLAGVIISIIAFWMAKKDKGYSTYLQSTVEYARLERSMVEHEELMQIYWGKRLYSKAKTEDELERESHRIFHFYYELFTILEVIFYAKEKNMLEDDQWEGWQNTVKNYIRYDRDHFVEAWKDSRSNYSKLFQTRIDELLRGDLSEQPDEK